MDVFKLDLDQAQIGSSLVETTKNSNNALQNNLCGTTGSAGQNDNLHSVDEEEEEDDDEVLPEVRFDAHTDFNLHFFDTPEDSSTQGGFSDPGSVESVDNESYIVESPSLNANTNAINTGSGSVLNECHRTYYQSTSAAATSSGNLRSAVISNHTSGSLVASSSSSGAATSTSSAGSFPQFGNGGGALYATNNLHNFTQSNSSSSGCSSTSSIASNSSSVCGSSSSSINGNGTSGSSGTGNNRVIGTNSSAAAGASSSASATSASLGAEHFIGNLNHSQSSSVSSSIASLASVKLPQGMFLFYKIGLCLKGSSQVTG